MVTKQKALEAAKLYLEARKGDARAQFKLAESIALGDFAEPIAPTLAKQVLKVYHDVDRQASKFTTRKLVSGIDRDETVQIIVVDSDQSNIPDENMGEEWTPGTLPALGARESYPQIGLFPFYEKTLRARKIGEAFGIDWETVVNTRGGEVDLIDNAITSFGQHAGNTEEADVAKLLVKRTGFSDKLVAAGRHMPGNLDFSDPMAFAEALQAFQETPVIIDGNRQNYTSYTLLCDPSQIYRYERMIQARTVRQVPARTGADSAEVGYELELNVDIPVTITPIGWEWLAKVFPGIGKGFILVPNQGTSQYPILTSNYLRGAEQPTVFIKDSNSRQVGGGGVDVLAQGDFDSDAIATKIRHVHGASMLWGEGIIYSAGTNV